MSPAEHACLPEEAFVDLATATDEEFAVAGVGRMFFPLRGGVELFGSWYQKRNSVR